MKQAVINWDDVRGRLEASEKALQEVLSPDAASIEAVFRKRAIHLAKAAVQDQPAATRPVLIFRIAQERYAIRLEELAEVLPFQGCTPVPGTPANFLGVINVRGEIRPVIDLAGLLSGSSGNNSGYVLLLQRQAGLKVDDVEGLRDIPAEELPRPIQGQYVRAVESGSLMLLDVEATLSAVWSSKES